jgi:hypothetical protein
VPECFAGSVEEVLPIDERHGALDGGFGCHRVQRITPPERLSPCRTGGK